MNVNVVHMYISEIRALDWQPTLYGVESSPHESRIVFYPNIYDYVGSKPTNANYSIRNGLQQL